MDISRQVAEYKIETGKQVFDKAREEEKLRRVKALTHNEFNALGIEELFEQIWGEKFLDNNNTVMAHIGRLREKLREPARNPKFIKTVWGVGYTVV